MRLLLLIAFIAVPLAEIAVLIELGGVIGVAPTIGLVVLTAAIGVVIIRRQGATALHRARASLDADRLPVEPVIDGICLLLAGALLLTPGLITDAVGFLLLVPPLRRALAWRALGRLAADGHLRATVFGTGPGADRPPEPGAGHGPVIEGEFTPVDEAPPRPPDSSSRNGGRPSPWRN